MTVQRCLDKPVLKTTLTTEILENQTIGLTKCDVEVNIYTKDTKIVGKID